MKADETKQHLTASLRGPVLTLSYRLSPALACGFRTTMQIRIQTKTGEWKPFTCEIREQQSDKLTEIYVPAFDGTWLVGSASMVANIGGNDWAIYTIHPEDCAALCQQPQPLTP